MERRLLFIPPRNAFLKAVINPGAKGAQFHYSKTGKVEYGAEGSQFAGAAKPPMPKVPKPVAAKPAADTVPARGATRAAARRGDTKPGRAHVEAFAKAYTLLRDKALAIVEGAKNLATDAKLKMFHTALKAAHSWEHFEHKVKKLGGDAEELVTHTFIEMPELFEHVLDFMHDGGHAIMHLVANHSAELTHAMVNHGPEMMQMAQAAATHLAKSHQFGLFPHPALGLPSTPYRGHEPGSIEDCPGCREFRAKQASFTFGPKGGRRTETASGGMRYVSAKEAMGGASWA